MRKILAPSFNLVMLASCLLTASNLKGSDDGASNGTQNAGITTTSGSSSGIGMQLGKTNGAVVAIYLLPFGPADDAGIKPGSKIISVDGVSVENLSVNSVAQMVRGPVGTATKIVAILPDGIQRQFSLTRVDITALGLGSGVRERLLDKQTGLLIIRQFSEKTPPAVESALDSFTRQGVRNLVLDLRNNSGGSANAAADVAGMFVPNGTPLWKFRSKSQAAMKTTYSMHEQSWAGGLIVLVEHDTIAAAELVTAACQTSGRARVMGETTYGKGAIYSLVKQPDGEMVKNKVGEFYTANGDPIQAIGIKPDLMVTNVSDEELLSKAMASFSQTQQ
jgi:carboxyl-terminal processing protease